MTAFRYKAVNLEGDEESGIIEADTQEQARDQLLQKGLYPTELNTPKQLGLGLSDRMRIRRAVLPLLTRQWATLLEAGVPVDRSLSALIEQNEEPQVQQVLSGVRNEVIAGHLLHRALERFDNTFNTLYRSLVEAGEHSGQLGAVMLRLAEALESSHELRQKLIQAMIYPTLILIVSLLVVLGLMIYVVPQVVSVFQSGKQSLPLLTQALILLSDTLRAIWPALLVLFIAGWWAARRALRVGHIRLRWHLWLMRLPGLGRLLVTLDSARLAQTLAILVNSGVPLLAALEAGHGVLRLTPLQHALASAQNDVREGMSLYRALSTSKHFPPLMLHMIGSGEQSGQLGILLHKAAHQQEQEVNNRLTMAVSIFEPLLILCMGIVVLLIVLAILQPIIEINQLIK